MACQERSEWRLIYIVNLANFMWLIFSLVTHCKFNGYKCDEGKNVCVTAADMVLQCTRSANGYLIIIIF